jgi:hypothetical protein
MVEGAYWDFETIKIDKGYVTLASCMDKVLLCNGDNEYKIPHLTKDKMIREGSLAKQLAASDKALVMEHQELENEGGLAMMLQESEELEELSALLQQWDEDEAEQTMRDEHEVLEWLDYEEIQELALYCTLRIIMVAERATVFKHRGSSFI